MEDYIQKYNGWLSSPLIDEDTKNELNSIKNNDEEIKDRFYKDLEFGTAGLRGIMGAGTNRMNKYTVTRSTQGLANYINKNNLSDNGVVIAYDCRNNSKEFSEETALCLNANGIKTYVFDSLRPVPELSFAVRELNATAGIMITASHNPPKYNGYKVYWDDGAQIVTPRDAEIIEEVENTNFEDIKTISKDDAIKSGLYVQIGEDVDKKFIDKLKSLVLNPDVIRNEDIKIVYSPLHGTGGRIIERLFNELGFKNLYIVKEQEMPDGNFPTVEFPNPEYASAFELALNLAKEIDADVIVANDPDADRIGIYSKSSNGEYIAYNGNMCAELLMEYELSQRQKLNILPTNGAIISTIVSTDMTKAIAKAYNMAYFETFTGFKWVGKKVREFEENNNNYSFQFGFEESYGCIVSPHTRDKDGISAAMCVCEAAAYYKSLGLSLWDEMINIYNKYGFYKEKQVFFVLEGFAGAEEIKNKMDKMRSNPPKMLASWVVEEVRDYEKHIITRSDGSTCSTDLPTSNVLYYALNDNAWCCVRPSGTEPKIKFYMGVKGTSMIDADCKLEELSNAMMNFAG